MKKELPVVSKLIARSKPIGLDAGLLKDGERILSFNAIAGSTLDVPIEATCQPSKVCVRDCYAASSRQAMPAMLAHQYRVQNSMEADPEGFAERLAAEFAAKGFRHLRWNGVGDLSLAAVQAINWLGRNRPDMTIWVVTRKPLWAAMIEEFPQVFVHFSLDKHSMERRIQFLEASPRSQNFFFSYQCERDEVSPEGLGVSVIFHRRYKPPTGANLDDPALCPLNKLDDCTNACTNCRRCFNGEAVAMRLAVEGGVSEQR